MSAVLATVNDQLVGGGAGSALRVPNLKFDLVADIQLLATGPVNPAESGNSDYFVFPPPHAEGNQVRAATCPASQ